MRSADRVAGVLLLAFAVGFAVVALQFTYWGDHGPGSGFLPFWLGGAMAVLAVLLLISTSRRDQGDAAWLPVGRARTRLLLLVLLSIAFVAALRTTGMIPGMALFLFVVLRFLERYRLSAALGVATGMALANYLVFVRWLGVPFPIGALGF